MNRHDRRKDNSKSQKKQHYVPKSYLEAWLDPARSQLEEPFVWIFDRDGPTNDNLGKRKSPSNVFRESEMYTITPPDDPSGRDLSLEIGLGQIEGDFCSLRRDFIEPMRRLGSRERAKLLAFATAGQFRTPSFREHIRSQWKPVLDLGQEMQERMTAASPEERHRLAIQSAPPPRNDGPSLTLGDVQAVVDKPHQSMLAAYINATLPLLLKTTYLTIFCTAKNPGFITSDNPVVWWDPESYKRAPLHQSPALMYETLEITMPISPSRLMFLSMKDQNWPQYVDLDAQDYNQTLLDDFNRRTCRHADEKIVVSCNEYRSIWAEQGEQPR